MNRINFSLFFTCFFIFNTIFGQNTAPIEDSFSVFFFQKSTQNFSLLPYSTPHISLNAENSYLLEETFHSQLRCHFQWQEHHFLYQLSHFGFSKYGEIKNSFGYSRLLFSKLGLNFTFHYLVHYAQQYQATHSLSFDVSLAYFLSNKWLLTLKAENPACLKYGIIGNYYIPTSIEMEHHLFFMKHGALTILAKQTLKGKFNAGLGFLYQIKKIGFSITTTLLYSNFYCTWFHKKWGFSFENIFHYQLGYSPKISIVFHFSNN